MKKKNILITILLTIVSLFMCIEEVWANTPISPNDSYKCPESKYPARGYNVIPTSPSWRRLYSPTYNGIAGFRMAVLKSDGKTLVPGTHVIDVIYTNNQANKFVSNTRYTKIQYANNNANKPSSESYNVLAINSNKQTVESNYVYDITKLDISGSFSNFLSGGTITGGSLEGFFKNNSYRDFYKIILLTGYSDFNEDDIVAVDVLMSYDKYIGTAYELIDGVLSTSTYCTETNNNSTSWHKTYVGDCESFYETDYGKSTLGCVKMDRTFENGTVICSHSWCLPDKYDGSITNTKHGYKCPTNNKKYYTSSNCELCNGHEKPCEQAILHPTYWDPGIGDNKNSYGECAELLLPGNCRDFFDNRYSETTTMKTLAVCNSSEVCEEYATGAVARNCVIENYYHGYDVLGIFSKVSNTIFAVNSITVDGKKYSFPKMTSSSNLNITGLKSRTELTGAGGYFFADLNKHFTFFNLHIYKTYNDEAGSTDKKDSGITFTLTKGSTSVTCTTDAAGNCNFKGISPGTWVLKEKIGTGYGGLKDEEKSKIKCEATGTYAGTCSGNPTVDKSKKTLSWNIKITKDHSDKKVEKNITNYYTYIHVTNWKLCNGIFDEFKNSMAKRVEYYVKFKDMGYNYNQILNWSNQTAEKACSNVDYKLTTKKGCFSSKTEYVPSGTVFNENNISAFTEIVELGKKKYAYCSTMAEINNDFNKVGIYTFLESYKFNDESTPVHSGQMLFPLRDSVNGIIGIGNITKQCYIYPYASSNSTIVKEDTNVGKEYLKYVSGATIDGKELDIVPVTNPKDIDEKPVTLKSKESVNSYVKTYSVYYALKKVYSEYGTGKISITPGNNKRLLGQSVFTSFNDKIINKKWLKLENSLTYKPLLTKNAKDLTDEMDAACTYYVEQEIIDTCDSTKEKNCRTGNEDFLRIEYRTIDTKTPFPGESGTSVRAVGANWCGTLARTGSNASINIPDCSNSNNIVEKYIKNSTNSYGRVESTSENKSPKYSFTLNATNIRQIRNYRWNNNKVYDYDDFASLNFDDNGNSSSPLLESFGIEKKS